MSKRRRICDFLLSVLVLLIILVGVLLRAGHSQAIPWWQIHGAIPMCKELPVECAPYAGGSPFQMQLTPSVHRELERINREVNKQVEYIGDKEHYGVPERWTYPVDGKGDCEDYALEKRRRLVELGYPRRLLLIAVVEFSKTAAELHAVLIVRTDIADMVLDNNRGSVVDKVATPYRFLYIQSQRDPRDYDKVKAN